MKTKGLLLISHLVGLVAVRATECSCSVEPKSRIDCGYYGITETECVNIGCCWGSSNLSGVPWCFYTASGGKTTDCQQNNLKTCEVSVNERKDCGYYGINQQKCIDIGCCWAESNVSGVPWCFYSKNLPETTTTTTKKPTITSTTTTTTISKVNPTLQPSNGIRIMFEKPNDWNNVYLWAWDNNQQNIYGSVWPGKPISYFGGSWYYYDFNENIKNVNILFNNGNGVQTKDINGVTKSTCYGLESSSNVISKTCPQSEDIKSTTITTRTPRTTTTKNNKPTETIAPVPVSGNDFREETIYFLMTARFFDGDTSNNIHCRDDAKAKNGDDDPCFRGDFKGIIDKLDYIKALGFTAIWITPVVENGSSYDYHGYHALNFDRVDPRLESKGATYQDLINACHKKGIKIIQDIVLNHTSNNGERGLFPMISRDYHLTEGVTKNYDEYYVDDPNNVLPDNYENLSGSSQYNYRDKAMKSEDYIYRKNVGIDWEGFSVTTGQFAGDCEELNTELPLVYEYLVDTYNKYIDMGVDAFRIDTVKHISRLTLNNAFIPKFREHAKSKGNDNFYMVGEIAARCHDVLNHGVAQVSPFYYTWAESKDYGWNHDSTDGKDNLALCKKQWEETATPRTSNNVFLDGNNYHQPDYSSASGLSIIDFTMHHSFESASNAYNVGRAEDQYVNDSTWNVVYVDSHDYGPNMGGNDYNRYMGSTEDWAENLNLMFTWRGIPCIYYGSEIEFQKAKKIDDGPNMKLSDTGRAYFGDHIEGSVNTTDFGIYSDASGPIAETLNYPLAQHIRRLNLIRRRIPALQKGQYSSVDGHMAFKRRYTDNKTDSFVCVSITGGATFNGLPGGTYKEVITGDVISIPEGGSISIPSIGKGNMRIWVLDTNKTPAPGKIGSSGKYLK